MLNGVLSMHMTLLGVGIPLWIVGHTAAPPAAVGVLLVLNTVLAVVFQLPISRGLDTGRGAARLLGRSGAVLGVSCMLLAAAARVPAGLVVPVLVVAVLVHTLGELQQSAGGWALSFQLAPPDRQSSYLSLFSIGVTVQRIVGPVLVTSVVLTRGTAGWVGLAAVLLAAGFATTRSRRGRHLQRPRHRRPRRAASRPPQVALRPPASVATLTGACAPVVLRNPPTVRRRRARTAAR